MSRGRAASLVVLIAALLFRLALALALANDEPDDGRLYALIGHNVIAHGAYSASEDPPYAPTYVRVPGYPLLLASVYGAFGDRNNTAVRAVQALIDTATCWLVGALAAAWAPRAWVPAARERTGRLAFVIAAACPFPAIYVATILTETLAMFAGTFTILLATRALQATRDRGVGLQGPSGAGRALSGPRDETGSDVPPPSAADRVAPTRSSLPPEIGTASAPIATGGLSTVDAQRSTVDGQRSTLGSRRWPFNPAARAWTLTGAAAGTTAIVRPELILYAGAAAGAILIAGADGRPRPSRVQLRDWWHRVIPAGAALTLGVVLVLAPWTVRNARVFGELQPLNPRSVAMPGEFVAYGYARWVRTWIDHPRYVAPALFTVDLAPIEIGRLPPYAFDSAAERSRVAALLAAYNTPAPDADPDEAGQLPPGGMTPAIDAAFAQLARERIAAHPVRYYVVLPLQRAMTLWFDTHADFYPFDGYLFPVSAWDREMQQQVWLPLFALLMGAWTIAGWAGAWQLARHRDTRLWLAFAALLIVPRLALLASLENPEPRYTVEFFPIVSALAGLAIGAWVAGQAADAGRPAPPGP